MKFSGFRGISFTKIKLRTISVVIPCRSLRRDRTCRGPRSIASLQSRETPGKSMVSILRGVRSHVALAPFFCSPCCSILYQRGPSHGSSLLDLQPPCLCFCLYQRRLGRTVGRSDNKLLSVKVGRLFLYYAHWHLTINMDIGTEGCIFETAPNPRRIYVVLHKHHFHDSEHPVPHTLPQEKGEA
jgi:hypothetical protein